MMKSRMKLYRARLKRNDVKKRSRALIVYSPEMLKTLETIFTLFKAGKDEQMLDIIKNIPQLTRKVIGEEES